MWPGGGAGAMRASGFALSEASREPDSLLGPATSQLMYPPIGSTFEGLPSKSVEAVRISSGIDVLSDLQYQKKPSSGNSYEEMMRDVATSSVPKSQRRPERDQLDTFLSDFTQGRATADALRPPATSSFGPRAAAGFRTSSRDPFSL